jgi:hypothetical protein
MCELQNTYEVAWGAHFDATIREVWGMMEEYVDVRHGKDCTNLRWARLVFNHVHHTTLSHYKDNMFLIASDGSMYLWMFIFEFTCRLVPYVCRGRYFLWDFIMSSCSNVFGILLHMLHWCNASRALMEEFDDAEELSKSKNGSLLLQLIEVSTTHSHI